MLHGKTSNLELDAIFEKYLPKGKVLPCDTMVHMEERSMAAIGAAARRHKTVYLPIFTRNHWIAAIVYTKSKGSGQTTTSTFGVDIYDSAPSFAVTRDIVKMFAPYRRNYALNFVHTAPHQQRGSEDCGLFMALAFFVFELHMEDAITAAETLPRALRPLFAHILERPEKQRPSCTDLHAVLRRLFREPSDDTRQHIVKTFLNRDRTKALQGGARSPRKPRQTKLPPGATNEEEDFLSQHKNGDPFLDAFGNDIPVSDGDRQSPVRYSPRPSPPPPRQRKMPPNRSGNKRIVFHDVDNDSDDEVADVDDETVWTVSDHDDEAEEADANSITTTTTAAESESATDAPHPSHSKREPTNRAMTLTIEHHVQQVLNRSTRELTAIRSRRITYILAAMALLSVGRGDQKQLRAQSMTNFRAKHSLPGRKELSPHEVLDIMGVPHFRLFLNEALPVAKRHRADDADGNIRDAGVYMRPATPKMLTTKENRERLAALYVRGLEGLTMPTVLFFNKLKYRFRMGVEYTRQSGRPTSRDNEEEEDGNWHYSLTTDASRSLWAVYLPCRWHTYGSLKQWESGATAKGRQKQEQQRTPKPGRRTSVHHQHSHHRARSHTDATADDDGGDSVDDEEDDRDDDLDEILHDDPEYILQDMARPCLNVPGRTDQRATIGGSPSCPRNWYLFTSKPPHVPLAAWRAKSHETRRRHINWLQTIKTMPPDLLDYHSLTSAIVELVLRTYRHSRPAWSTVGSNLALIAGALKDLPLYSRETQGIDLNQDVTWRAVQRTIKMYSQREETRAPLPLAVKHYIRARDTLRHKSPLADLFLALMWNCAARPGDITTLLVSDVQFCHSPNVPPPNAPPISMNAEDARSRVYVLVWMARGKGSHFRSPYEVIATLSQEDASTLLKHMQSRLGPNSGRVPHNSAANAAQRRQQKAKRMRLFTSEDARMVRKTVRTVLQSIDTRMTLSSVRKGAIRYCARMGMTRDALRAMTGHTTDKTLNRYLGVGHRTTEAEMRGWDTRVGERDPTTHNARRST